MPRALSEDGDVSAIQALFHGTYGDRYSHPEFVATASVVIDVGSEATSASCSFEIWRQG